MEPFIGTITIFGGNFAPRGWAKCEGQLLAIDQYSALFSLLGTNYGGDGRKTFGLPDLRGRVVAGTGSGPGLNTITLGEKKGAETNTLSAFNIPRDTTINFPASSEDADSDEPAGKVPAVTSTNSYISEADDYMAIGTIKGATNAPINNIQPVLSSNYIIALQGIYPSRS